MASRTQRIAQYSFDRTLRELGMLEGKLQKLPNKLLKELAFEVRDLAQENFADAYYAGPEEDLNDIVVEARTTASGNWSVTARGKAVAWVEFGTGVEGEDAPYEGNLPASYEYGSGSAGPPSHPGDQDYWYFNESSDMGNAYNVQEHIKYKTVITKQQMDKGRSFVEVEEEQEVGRAYSTTGNPANNCLYNAFQEVAESVPDRLEEYMSK